MTIGKRIREYRNREKMSQEQLAELVGVSRQAVAKWEGDKAEPSTGNLVLLAKIFGISLDDLSGNAEAEPAGEGIEEEETEEDKMDRQQATVRDEDKRGESGKRTFGKRRGFVKIYLIVFATAMVFLICSIGGGQLLLDSAATLVNLILLVGMFYVIGLVIRALRKYLK